MELTKENLPLFDPEAPKRPKRRRHIIAWCVLLYFLIDFFQVFVVRGVTPLFAGLENGSMFTLTLGEVIPAIVGALAIGWLGGRDRLRIRREDVVLAVRRNWWFVLLAVLNFVWALASNLAAGEEILAYWPLQVIITLVMCLGIGFFEEGMYRGLLLGGFLARSGGTKRGMYVSIAVSVVIFGLVHTSFAETTPVVMLQNLLKTIQAGMLGLAFAAVALRTRSPWPAAFLHAGWDFLSMAGDVAFTPSVSVSYTSSSASMSLVYFYLILIALQSPMVVVAIRTIREVNAPDFGWLPPARPRARDIRSGVAVVGHPVETNVEPVAADGVVAPAAPAHFSAPAFVSSVSSDEGPKLPASDGSRSSDSDAPRLP